MEAKAKAKAILVVSFIAAPYNSRLKPLDGMEHCRLRLRGRGIPWTAQGKKRESQDQGRSKR
jgi:hypothetical protein